MPHAGDGIGECLGRLRRAAVSGLEAAAERLPWLRRRDHMNALRNRSEGEAALAAALEQRCRYTLISFHSPHCSLCRSLKAQLEEAALSRAESLGVVLLDTEAPDSVPEMLHYGVDSVPCFVLLRPTGEAVLRSPAPTSRDVMRLSLKGLLSAVDERATTNEPSE